MSELVFDVVDVTADPYAAGPTLRFIIRVAETSGNPVHALALRVQIRIEPARRRYTPEQERRLLELFGEPSRWGDTLKAMQFAQVSAVVPGFTGSTDVQVDVPCTYDLEIAATKYLHALDDGEIPLLLLFSGTVFYKTADKSYQVAQVPWSKEASFRLPAATWRQMMDYFYPGSGWLRVDTATIDALMRFKAERALPTWEQTFKLLLKEAGEEGL
ncbi:MAG: DUF6084 family protein [Euzebya sp.]